MNEFASCSMTQAASSRASSNRAQEDAWVAASQAGDTQAFNRLILSWERRIYNLSLRMLQDREEAAEATQEVFLLAYRHIKRFRRDSRFSTWLYRIAINHCTTRITQRPPGTHYSLEDEAENPCRQLRTAETQHHDLLRSEQRSRVHAALSYMPAEQRAVIELKFFQELTFEEISAVLGVALSTVKSRLYAGLEMLKTRLGCKPD